MSENQKEVSIDCKATEAAAAQAATDDLCMAEDRPQIDSWDHTHLIAEDAQMDEQKTEKALVKDEETKSEQEAEQHPNWIPPELRRPEDEFYDLSCIQALHEFSVDENLVIMTTVEGKGYLPEACDTVYYKHQTRYDNGQLVSFEEKRKVVDMVVIDNKKYQAYLNACFKHMRRG